MGESERRGEKRANLRIKGEGKEKQNTSVPSAFFSIQLSLVYVRERKREKVFGSIRYRK